MCEKALKAMFKLKSLLNNTHLNPQVALKLFDQLIKPIALYGSEIWGPDTIKYSDQDQTKFSQSIHKFACEKLNSSFAQFILGIHRKAQGTAILGELGRYPLGIDITANSVLYLKHLLTDKVSPLLRDAIVCNSYLPGGKGWSHKVDRIQHYIFNENRLSHCGKVQINRKSIKYFLESEYNTHWLGKIKTEPKMRTYVKFKYHFVMEDYLSILSYEHRRSFSRFRISAHNLAIERGQYTRPPTPIINRTCQHCPTQVEDEFHFLLECTAHQSGRLQLLDEIKHICPQFAQLDDHHKFVYMLSATGDTTKLVAHFIHHHTT
jgi:hypothetical protein